MEIKNKKIGYLLCAIIIAIFFAFFPTISVRAENPVGFNYKVEYPENQIGSDKGYYDLLMTPGKKQTVVLKVTNPGEKPVKIGVSVNGTKTNSNGVIEYGDTLLENDKSLKFPFEEVVSAPEILELKPGGVTDLKVNIKMPETSFDGMILGGIQLKKIEEKTEKKAEGATVKNEYAYVVAMILKLNEKELKPEIAINKAFASQENYRNTIGINLSNTTASLMSGKMSVEAQIMKKGSQEVLFERKQTGMSFAPNTQMNFPVSMNGERMVKGDYTADVLVVIEDKKWQKSVDFKITEEEADKYNKRDVGLVQDRGIDWKTIALIVVGFLVVVVGIFIVVKLVKKQPEKKVKSRKKSSSKR